MKDDKLPWASSKCRQTWACREVVGVFVVLFLLFGSSSLVHAQGIRSVWDDLVRGTARVADDVPVKKVDDLVAELSQSRAARDALETEISKAGRVTGKTDALRRASRSDEVLRLLRSATAGLDPSVMRRIEQLDEASRDAALVLAKGGAEFTRTVPDIATRGRLLREGGVETVAAVGMFGPDAARSALRLDAALQGGSVVVREGSRAVTLADFGSAMTRYGDASWKFWGKYIRPHWKIWAVSGALAAYLANPEYFQDSAGNLLEAGFRHLTEFAGEAAASAIRGVGQGSATAAERVSDAARDTFFSENGIYAAVGVLVFLICVSFLFRRIRYWLLRPFRWLNRSPVESGESEP